MARKKGEANSPRMVNYTGRVPPEYIERMKAEAVSRTKSERLFTAKERAAGSGLTASQVYSAHEATGTLSALGPEITMGDINRMAIDLYLSLGPAT